jgi:putative flippase GtrA
VRGAKRETISRAYNLLLHATLGVGFSDAQCGFKAIRGSAARELLPLVADTSWFFDTELLVLAERAGLRIHEVPVDWIDDADSRVDIVATALGDLRGIRRVGWGLMRGSLKVPQLRAADPGYSQGLAWQLPRFVAIGVASTVAYVVLYLLLRGFMGAQAANAVALLLTAVGNTAANRRLTFGVRGRAGAARHQFRGLIAFGAGLALTSAALAVLHSSSRALEVLVLIAANLAATLLRFVLYRGWVFGQRGDGRPAGTGDAAGVRGFAAPAGTRDVAPAAPWSSEPFSVMSDQPTGSTR